MKPKRFLGSLEGFSVSQAVDFTANFDVGLPLSCANHLRGLFCLNFCSSAPGTFLSYFFTKFLIFMFIIVFLGQILRIFYSFLFSISLSFLLYFVGSVSQLSSKLFAESFVFAVLFLISKSFFFPLNVLLN